MQVLGKLLFFIILFIPAALFGQDDKEQLLNRLWDDTVKTETRIVLGNILLTEHSHAFSYADWYDTYSKLGELYMVNSESKKSLECYRALFIVAQNEKETIDQADLKVSIGRVFLEIGNLDSAQENFSKAIDYFELLGLSTKAAMTEINLGIVSYERANYDHAITISIKALEVLKTHGETIDVYGCITSLGLVHLAMENYSSSLDYFRKALHLSKGIADGIRIGKTLNNIGLTHLRSGDNDSALVFLENAKRVNLANSNRSSLFHTFVQMAEVKGRLGQSDSALYYFHRGRYLQNRIENQNALAETWDKLSRFHLENGTSDSAKTYAQKALGVSRKIGAKEVALHALETLHILELSKPNSSSSVDRFKAFVALRDSIISEKSIKEIQNAEAKFKNKLKAEEISNLKTQQTLQEQRTLYATVASILFLSLTIVTIVYQRNKRRSKDRLIAEQKKAHKAEVIAVKKEQELSTFKAKVQAQEKERTRISRELHDGITPAIAAVKMKATQSTQDEELLDSLSKITHDLRSLSHQLAPVALDFHSLEESIAHFLSNFDGADGLLIHLKLPSDGLPPFSQEVQISVFRTVQELMTNILKHSKASEARFEFEISGHYLSLQVVDNGIGFAPNEQQDGIGFTNLKQRVKELGGRLTISPNQGIGTQVYVEIPLPN